MATAKMSDSARIRSKLDHPIVDVDGHVVELTPVILEFITQVGGGKMAEAYLQAPRIREFYHRGNVARPAEERRDMWSTMGHWWSQPVDTLDRATVAMPRLLNERLEEFGIDFTTLYPSEGLFISSIEDPELRRVCCRAYNKYTADVLSEYSDRMTGVAIVPMITPEEAVGELEYAMNDLGLKAAVFSASVRRPIAKAEREHPEAAYLAGRMELFAIDSDHDYDKLWAKCVELKVAVTFHGGIGSAGSASYSNYIFNHIGGLAKGNSQMCKALLMGGVTRRFPTLKFAFLEGGVGWARPAFVRPGGPLGETQREDDPYLESGPSGPRAIHGAGGAVWGRHDQGTGRGDSRLVRRGLSSPGGYRRLRGVRDRDRRRAAGPLCPELLFRMRGRRPGQRRSL